MTQKLTLISGTKLRDINWGNILKSTVESMIFARIGGAGLSNFGAFSKYLHASSKYVKAATSYDKVLNKIKMGLYKSKAGEAGARFLTSTKLERITNLLNIQYIFKALGLYTITTIIQK